MTKQNLIKNIFCILCILFIAFLSITAVTEYYFNPDYSNIDREYLEYLDKRYGNLGLNNIIIEDR